MSYLKMSTLRVSHNAGFFSCCMIRLRDIVNYFNTNQKLPDKVDSSKQFTLYKSDQKRDITHNLFAEEDSLPNIDYVAPVSIVKGRDCIHFPNYKNINFTEIAPFINKYFSPSPMIKERIASYEAKYKLDYDKTCLVYYRGNDKATESLCPEYNAILDKAMQVKQEHPEICFVVQSDEAEFIEYFLSHYPDATVLTELEAIKKNKVNPARVLPIEKREEHGYNFLAAIYFLSKIKYIVTTTHNAATWLCLFRGHSDGVYQYLHMHHTPTKMCPENNYWFA